MADEIKALEARLKELKLQKLSMETPEEKLTRLRQELADLQSGKRVGSSGVPKEKKEPVKKDGVNFIPVGRSGKSLVPLAGKDVKAFKVKNLRFQAAECRKQAQTLLERADILDNDANELENENTNTEGSTVSTDNSSNP
jgi:hypothetical protein